MKREVVWTKMARQAYVDTLLQIQEDWGDELAVTFAQKVEKIIELIAETPFMYPATFYFRDINIRRCVLSKQTSLYYLVSDEEISLLTFFDNRRNPDDLADQI